jgi:hypothetical protein
MLSRKFLTGGKGTAMPAATKKMAATQKRKFFYINIHIIYNQKITAL